MFSVRVQVELETSWCTQASPLNIESSLGYLGSWVFFQNAKPLVICKGGRNGVTFLFFFVCT